MSGLLAARRSLLDRSAADGVDVLVVGGGINGVGVALDAAARGLRTLLVERDDIGVGTSSRSSKLIHGGLRYLEHYEFGLVREALVERALLRQLAPHLVRLERFLVPLVGPVWEVPYIGAGLTLYDLLGGRHGGRFRYLPAGRARVRVPSLTHGRLRGAFEYTDGVVDDARYLMAVADTARRLGAGILTRTEVTALVRGGSQVRGARVLDRLEGREHDVAAGVVIDATGAFPGPWTAGRTVVPSRGSHLVVPRHLISSQVGLTIRVPDRVVFTIPWDEHWLIGTTDVPHHGEVDRPPATTEEVEYLLETLGRVLDIRIKPDDLVATFAGIRPLAGADELDTAAISREERIQSPVDGLVVIRGGKFTTYRRIAERTMNLAVGRLPRSASGTRSIPLTGSAPFPALEQLSVDVGRESGFDTPAARHLVDRYGTDALEVAATGAELGLNEPLVPDLPYLRIEAWWGIHREHALSIDDVLARRTRIAIKTPDHGVAAAGVVADLLSEVFGWDSGRRAEEVRTYLAGAAAEYGTVPTNTGTPE